MPRPDTDTNRSKRGPAPMIRLSFSIPDPGTTVCRIRTWFCRNRGAHRSGRLEANRNRRNPRGTLNPCQTFRIKGPGEIREGLPGLFSLEVLKAESLRCEDLKKGPDKKRERMGGMRMNRNITLLICSLGVTIDLIPSLPHAVTVSSSRERSFSRFGAFCDRLCRTADLLGS